MFNNNINKPAITVFLPLTSAKTIFAGTVFSAEKTGFYRSLAKTCQPCWRYTAALLLCSYADLVVMHGRHGS